MRTVAAKRHERDVFYVHHGSISAMLREEAEAALREGVGPAVAAATVTLELGIDLGSLERVLQIGAPYSASSFVQRLGRSGRRWQPSEMLFVCPEEEDESAPLPSRIPWTLLRAIAVIELYVKEKWIEPFTLRHKPMGLLYHQTMSTLKSIGETEPRELADRVLALPAFQEIGPEEFDEFLLYLAQTDHVQHMEDGGVIIGLAGEKIVNNFRFYAVFQDDEEYAVYCGTEEIGSITTVPPPGYAMTLAGRSWRVTEVDDKHKAVYVEAIRGRSDTLWLGAGGDVIPGCCINETGSPKRRAVSLPSPQRCAQAGKGAQAGEGNRSAQRDCGQRRRGFPVCAALGGEQKVPHPDARAQVCTQGAHEPAFGAAHRAVLPDGSGPMLRAQAQAARSGNWTMPERIPFCCWIPRKRPAWESTMNLSRRRCFARHSPRTGWTCVFLKNRGHVHL